MTFNEELFFSFITKLEKRGVPLSTEKVVNVQKVFSHGQFITMADVLSAQHILIAVLAKDEQQQLLLKEVFSDLATPDPQTRRLTVVHLKSILQKPFGAGVRATIRRYKRLLILISAGLMLLTIAAIFYLLNDRFHEPALKIRILSQPAFAAGQTLISTTWTDKPLARYNWRFGDGATVSTLKPVVSHMYKRSGRFKLELTVTENGKTNNTTLFLQVRKAKVKSVSVNADTGAHGRRTAIAFADNKNNQPVKSKLPTKQIALKQLPLINQVETGAAASNGFLILKLLAAVLAIYAFVWITYYLKLPALILAKYFDTGKDVMPPLKLRFQIPGLRYQAADIDELCASLGFRTAGSGKVFDLAASVSKSAGNLGFPEVVLKEERAASAYIVLIEVRKSNDFYNRVIESLVDELAAVHPGIERIYFSPGLKAFWGANYPLKLSRHRFIQLFTGKRLLIYSSGYSFLSDYHTSGFYPEAEAIVDKFDLAALITPVPRNNWGMAERRLLDLLPMFAADMSGHRQMARFFQTKRYVLSKRDGDFVQVPLMNDISAYKHYFVDTLRKQALFTWLLALAVPDEISYELLLLTGRVTEQHLGISAGGLVNHDNILKLSVVSWVQNRDLASVLRFQVIRYLGQESRGQALISSIYQKLLERYNSVGYPENSIAAVLKKIKIASYTYKLDNERGRVETAVMEGLHEKGLLDSYTSSIVGKQYAGKYSPRYRILLIYLIASFLTIFALLDIAGKNNPNANPLGWIIKSTDSSVYFNNAAVSLANGKQDEDQLIQAKFLLQRSMYRNPFNDTAVYNYYVVQYRLGRLYYARRNYDDGLRIFTILLNDADYMPFKSIRDVENTTRAKRNRESYAGLNAMLLTIRKDSYYAGGVCQYYKAITDTNALSIDVEPEKYPFVPKTDTGLVYRAFPADLVNFDDF